MIIYLLDKDFTIIRAADTFTSLQWNTKYYAVGDFEVHFPVGNDDLSLLGELKETEYLYIPRGIYTGIKQFTEYKNGDCCVKGKFLEDLLNKRVVSERFAMNGSASDVAREMVRRFAIEPSDPQREIASLKLGKVEDTGGAVHYSQRGKHLDECAGDLIYPCENTFNLRYDFADGNIYFDILRGSDAGALLFSGAYDNIAVNSERYSRSDNYKNFAYVAGMGQGEERVIVTVDLRVGNEDIKELWVDARDLQQEENQSGQAYRNILATRGRERLAKYSRKETAEFEAAPGVECKLGDKCEYVNPALGIRAEGRVTEISEVFEPDGVQKRIRVGEDQLGIMETINLMK